MSDHNAEAASAAAPAAPVEVVVAPKVVAPTRPLVRDTIHLAFKDSQYPTPYGDSTIPGNKPGVRVRHLGRRYAPCPINHSQLTHALTAPGVVIEAPQPAPCPFALEDMQYGTNIPLGGIGPRRPCLLGPQNYVLNVKNGGRAHYAEQRGTEERWVCGVQQVDPPISCYAPRRKGMGVYNMDHAEYVYREAEDAREVRERQKERSMLGKAQVAGSSDHSLIELSMWHMLYKGGERRRETCPASSAPHHQSAAVDTEAKPTTTHDANDFVADNVRFLNNEDSANATANAPPVVAAQRTVFPAHGFAFSSPSMNEKTDIAKGPYRGSVRRGGDVAFDSREARDALRLSRLNTNRCTQRNEDIIAVRNLPNI